MANEEKVWCVYRHTSPSGKVYIGITCQNPVHRWSGGWGYRTNEYFTRAIQKYGWKSFTHEILHEGLTKQEACAREIELIAYHRSNDRDFGYNILVGGELARAGCKHTLEARKKMSEARLRDPNRFGRKFGEETLAKMSKNSKERWLNEEYRKRISEANLGEKSPRAHAVMCIETGEVFPCIRYASDKYGIQSSCISAACRGKIKTSGGYHWQYVDEINKSTQSAIL